MKTLKSLILLGTATSMMMACNHSKNPAGDINDIRAHKQDGKQEKEYETKYVIKEVPVDREKIVYVDKEVKVEVEKPIYIDKEVKVEVEKPIYIDKEVPVTKEQATVDGKYVIITADPAMKFIEGQTGSFKVHSRSMIPGLKIELAIASLPSGATFQKVSDSEMVTYELKWSPTVAMIPSSEVYKVFDLKISATVTEVPQGRSKEDLQKLMRDKEVLLFVLRSQKAPSEVSVEGLTQEVSEGTITPFSVIATVHGVDDQSAQKPSLKISYDNMPYMAGSPLLVQDGSKHVTFDDKKAPTYLGQFRWKFDLAYDTKNIAVPPALGKDGKMAAQETATPVKLSLKVVSPFGAESPEMLKTLKIKHTSDFSAPKFDVAGLSSDTLELVPGETKTLKFKVQSAIAQSTTKVEIPDLSTMKGSPKVTCAAVKSTQECTLTWAVPCDSTESDLNQNLSLSAVATANGKNSNATQYVLKTSRAKTAAAACANTGANP